MTELKVIDSASQKAAIRISIPFRVAMDGKLMKTSLSKLAEAIGHRTCFSGVDCIFHLEKNFVIDENAAVRNISETYPEGSPAFKMNNISQDKTRLVTASLSEKDMMSIESISKVADKIAGMRAGCPACHSGFDFMFRNEIEVVLPMTR